MPLSPAPLTPGLTPLPQPGERPANARAFRLGAVFGLAALAVSLLSGQLVLARLVYFTPSLLARASSSQGGTTTATTFQGFSYLWTRRSKGTGGYTTPASLQNMQSEAHDFHMNTVVIPIAADMPRRNSSDLYWHTTDNYVNLDMLPDLDYAKAIDDARKAGLEPILELQVKVQSIENLNDDRAKYAGWNWYGLPSTQSLFVGGGGSVTVGTLEHTWIDTYTAFAVHFAQLAQSKNVHYFIIGDGLGNLTSDGPNSTAKADPQGIAAIASDGFDASKCSGRHECEWRHIIHAVRSASYSTYSGQQNQLGAKFTGRLIYAASWEAGDAIGGTQGEFEAIKWWDAVDAIGVDADFPLTVDADLQTSDLVNAWRGKGNDLAGQGDIYARLQQVANKAGKVIIFTAIGYESTQGSNSNPGRTPPAAYDQDEQLADMQAMLKTFTSTSWWAGTIWSYDQPVVPRSSQDLWRYGTQWAGDQLGGSKDTDAKKAGTWLATFYHTQSAPCLC